MKSKHARRSLRRAFQSSAQRSRRTGKSHDPSGIDGSPISGVPNPSPESRSRSSGEIEFEARARCSPAFRRNRLRTRRRSRNTVNQYPPRRFRPHHGRQFAICRRLRTSRAVSPRCRFSSLASRGAPVAHALEPSNPTRPRQSSLPSRRPRSTPPNLRSSLRRLRLLRSRLLSQFRLLLSPDPSSPLPRPLQR